eukprot:scaffold16278_cov107-Skeletonema_dohrnii-CCMP3373.AAC.1
MGYNLSPLRFVQRITMLRIMKLIYDAYLRGLNASSLLRHHHWISSEEMMFWDQFTREGSAASAVFGSLLYEENTRTDQLAVWRRDNRSTWTFWCWVVGFVWRFGESLGRRGRR